MTRWLWLALVCACAREEPPIATTATTAPPAIRADRQAAAEEPPRPPPPPPAEKVSPQPPPRQVAAFLAARSHDRAPWTARVGRRALSADDAAELARRLGENASYVNGDYGCVGQPVPYELARGDERFAFVEDCGHMRIGDDDHAALFSTDMLRFLRRVRGEP